MNNAIAAQTIGKYIVKQLGRDIKDIEENAGSMWITLEDGNVKSLMIIDCEKEEVEDGD